MLKPTGSGVLPSESMNGEVDPWTVSVQGAASTEDYEARSYYEAKY